MSPQLERVLKEWKLASPVSPRGLVFPNSEGNYQSADNLVKRRFKPAVERAGLSEIRFHDLRHTYACFWHTVRQ
jgi:integrase